jgi:hypothetical protein
MSGGLVVCLRLPGYERPTRDLPTVESRGLPTRARSSTNYGQLAPLPAFEAGPSLASTSDIIPQLGVRINEPLRDSKHVTTATGTKPDVVAF